MMMMMEASLKKSGPKNETFSVTLSCRDGA